MAGRWRELFRQDFTSTIEVEVVHNQDIEYPAVRVLIGDDFRPDLIEDIAVKDDDPTNILFVCFGSPQSGVIQIVEYDVIPVGVISSNDLVDLGLGQPDGVFGTEYNYVESLGATSTSVPLPTITQKVRLSVVGVAAGTYHVGVSFTWRTNATGASFYAQLEEDDTTVLWSQFGEPQDSNADQQYPGQGLAFTTLTAGNHTFDLDFGIEFSASPPDTATIEQARIEFWRLS